MASILLSVLFVTGPAAERPAPLSQSQIAKIQRIVRRTQDRNETLRAALDDRQQKLMASYGRFELNENRIGELHQEIIDLQRELLENYRELQVELRAIVGEQRFAHLKKRVDSVLEGKEKVQVSPDTSSSDGATEERRPDAAKS